MPGYSPRPVSAETCTLCLLPALQHFFYASEGKALTETCCLLQRSEYCSLTCPDRHALQSVFAHACIAAVVEHSAAFRLCAPEICGMPLGPCICMLPCMRPVGAAISVQATRCHASIIVACMSAQIDTAISITQAWIWRACISSPTSHAILTQ